MNIKKTALLILGLSFLSISALVAEDRTLNGTGLCPKCSLKEGSKCSNALIVNENGKDVTYYLTSKMKHKEFFCEGKTANLNVTGTVGEKDGKKTIKPKSIAVAEANAEVTLVGTGLCPKCALKEGGKCSNVLIVNEGGNDVKYYLTSKMKHKEFFCEGKTKGLSITGTVEEKGGKKMLAAKSIEKK